MNTTLNDSTTITQDHFTAALSQVNAGSLLPILSNLLDEAATSALFHRNMEDKSSISLKMTITPVSKQDGKSKTVAVALVGEAKMPTGIGAKGEKFKFNETFYVHTDGSLSLSPEAQTKLF